MPRDEIDDILDKHAATGAPQAPKPVAPDSSDEIDAILSKASAKPPLADDYANKGISLLNKVGRTALSGFGAVSRAVDSVTGAPVRAGIGALQNGRGVVGALDDAADQIAEDPDKAPSGKDIAEKAGFSADPTIKSPVIINPWKKSDNMLSPAGIAGGVVEAATDPTTYIPGVAMEKGAGLALKGAGKIAPPVAEYLARIAEERAVKAGTGGNISALRKMAGATAKGSDAEQAYTKLRSIGKDLLSTDEAGGPAVGWLDKAKDVGEKASAKADFYGHKIGDVASQMDQAYPKQAATAVSAASGGSVDGKDIAQRIMDYAATVPPHGEGKTVQNRLIEEAKNFQDRGPMSFKEVHDAKQQYPYKTMSYDALISNQDATNKIKSILTQTMDDAAKAGGEAGGVSPELAGQYKEARSKYSSYRPEADAAGDQALKSLSNRFVSPSSYGTGLAAGVASAAKHGVSAPAFVAAVAAGTANKVATERGSAFAARTANMLSKAISAAPEQFEKWMPRLEKAAEGGGNALSIQHHLLMNSDPDYRERIMRGGQ